MHELVNPPIGPVRFPSENILVRQPNSEYEKRLEAQGARVLSVNITPVSLRSLPEFQEKPLVVSVIEMLPLENGKVMELDWKKGYMSLKQNQSGGYLFNAGTHNEAASVSVARKITEVVCNISERRKPVVVATGLAECVKRLESQLQNKVVDINREFISPESIPQTLFQEMAQNYSKFLFSKYFVHNLDFIDLHTDPESLYIKPHFIEGRLIFWKWKDQNYQVNLDRENKLYDWLVDKFPHISVVRDVRPKAYFEKRLNQSLPDMLLACGFTHAATLECSAGKGINPELENEVLNQIMAAMLRDQVFEETSYLNSSSVYDFYDKTTLPKTVNTLFRELGDKSRLRRGSINFDVEMSGTFEVPAESMNKILRSNEVVGIIRSNIGTQELRIPETIDKCALLDTPHIGLAGISDEQRPDFNNTPGINISVAIPDFRRK